MHIISTDALSVVAPGTFTGTYGTLTLNADGTYSYALCEEFLRELARVKTMISVVSPPFLKAEGCRREFAAFYQHTTKQGGLWAGSLK